MRDEFEKVVLEVIEISTENDIITESGGGEEQIP